MATVNPWKRFIGLLPGGVRTVGTVVAVSNEANTSRVQLRNGVLITARGTSVAVNRQAFVTDGEVTGAAPDLPQFDIEV